MWVSGIITLSGCGHEWIHQLIFEQTREFPQVSVNHTCRERDSSYLQFTDEMKYVRSCLKGPDVDGFTFALISNLSSQVSHDHLVSVSTCESSPNFCPSSERLFTQNTKDIFTFADRTRRISAHTDVPLMTRVCPIGTVTTVTMLFSRSG